MDNVGWRWTNDLLDIAIITKPTIWHTSSLMQALGMFNVMGGPFLLKFVDFGCKYRTMILQCRIFKVYCCPRKV